MTLSTIDARRTNLTTRETNAFDRLAAMTVGYTTTIAGIVVTRWSADMFELDTYGRSSERIDEAAINLAARVTEVDPAPAGVYRDQEGKDMARALVNAGYSAADTERLRAEGMGLFELRERLTCPPGEVGSLMVTHGLRRVNAGPA